MAHEAEVRTQAEQAAEELLIEGNGGGLRFIPPIDPVVIASRQGISCKVAPTSVMSEKASTIEQHGQTFIVVDESLSYIEQRVLVAKSLGDIIYEAKGLTEDQNSKTAWSNYFAQGLLLPRSAVIALYSNGKYPKEIATMFYVTEAMVSERLAQFF